MASVLFRAYAPLVVELIGVAFVVVGAQSLSRKPKAGEKGESESDSC
jgi:hypothetical protein